MAGPSANFAGMLRGRGALRISASMGSHQHGNGSARGRPAAPPHAASTGAAAAARPAPLPGAGGEPPAAGAAPTPRERAPDVGPQTANGAAAPAPAPRAWWWLGAGIYPAVVASLTATRGSDSSGVAGRNVDQAVDFVLDRCFVRRSVHPVFEPLADATAAASTVATVMDSFLFGDADLPQ